MVLLFSAIFHPALLVIAAPVLILVAVDSFYEYREGWQVRQARESIFDWQYHRYVLLQAADLIIFSVDLESLNFCDLSL